MNSKIVIILTLCTIAIAKPKPGHEAPQPFVHTYNAPTFAKVAYPGPTVTKNVETYSAPSIEKTTTITRTITTPINAPNIASVHYDAPAAPVFAAAPVAHVAAVGYAGHGYAGHGFAGHGYAGAVAPFAAGFGFDGGIGGQTIYNAPSLGYNVGYGAPAVVAAPAVAAYAAPAFAPVAAYGAPAAVVKGRY